MATLNIVNLIETNPITKLSGTYNNKFVTRMQENFTETQQTLFCIIVLLFFIVNLIETNPITKLSGTYNNKFVTRMQENFTETQQKLFCIIVLLFFN
jgi:ABC-type anion transport system duplicated permease subunit